MSLLPSQEAMQDPFQYFLLFVLILLLKPAMWLLKIHLLSDAIRFNMIKDLLNEKIQHYKHVNPAGGLRGKIWIVLFKSELDYDSPEEEMNRVFKIYRELGIKLDSEELCLLLPIILLSKEKGK